MIDYRDIGDAFAALLAEAVAPADLEVIRQRNAAPEYHGDVCASHDFCDANMVMADAFERITGRVADPGSDCDATSWSNAWVYAKSLHLTALGGGASE